jgi:lipoprotein-anchoring transpeptidase ErfK/SrfK
MENRCMRNWLTRTRNRWIAGGLAALLTCAIVAGAVASSPQRGHSLASTTGDAAIPTIRASGVAPSSEPQVTVAMRPGKVILASSVDKLGIYDAAGGAVSQSLGKYTYYASPLTLMAIDTREVGGATWYEVSLPARPNGQTGWVRESDVAVSSTNTEIHVYLAEHELDVLVDGAVVMSAPVAVGSDKTPTPLGTFYVTDPLDFTANTTGVYGAYALGLSAYSDVLSTFNGGPPQIAIHGTNEPTLIGQSVSNGCIRMTNATILDLASRVGLGTPVIVSGSRDDA